MERLFTALQEERIIGVEIRVLAMDSTSVKVHRHATGAPEKGVAVRRRIPGRQERQSSRGVRRRVDARRNPFEPGRRARRGHGRRSMAAPVAFMGAKLLMDRVYEGDSTRLLAGSFGLTPVVPPKRNCADPWDHDRQAYKGRNVVERVFNRMKHCRKAATRYDRLDATFLANLQLALIAIQLKNTSKTTSVNTP